MRRLAFCLFFLILPNVVNAFDNFDIKWNIGNFGLGFNSFEYDYGASTEMFVDLLNIGVEHKNTRIGIEYNTVKIWYRTYIDNDNETKELSWSFLNLNLYWNIFDINLFKIGLNLFFGPFNRINYIHLNNKVIDWNKFIYSAGFRSGITLDRYNIISTEIGYRNDNKNNGFYMGINIDILTLLIFLMED